jgi:transcriptional regulator with XRE-family HTH domain
MLIAWRRRNGLTRKDAARILWCSAGTIGRWERGQSLPRAEPRLDKRLDVLQYALREFLSTTSRTIWVWENARSLPNRPLAVLAKLAECPPLRPKPLITPQKFGRLLRDWRKRRGLNQLEAAAVLGVGSDQTKISKWEKGRQMPRGAVLTGLLAKLTA